MEIRSICGETWQLADPQRRPLGRIVKTGRGFFVERDDGRTSGLERGPFPSLDLAMSAIASVTGGSCRLVGR